MIKALFFIAAVYDGVLGLAFCWAPMRIFSFHGVEPPNHPAYVQFPALLLLLFAAMFLRIAGDPRKNHALIPYGIGLKASYSGLAFWYALTRGIPSMWLPWAWADLLFLLLFTVSWIHLRKHRG